MICSETCALDLIGATYVRDVEPGEVVVLSAQGMKSIKPFAPAPSAAVRLRARVLRAARQLCVRRKRQRSAHRPRPPAGAGVVLSMPTSSCPIPDSGVCAAVGFAEASGIPMRMGLIRNHYVGRTFIQPQQSIRHFGVKVKLNPVRSIIEGKRVVLVDDSIVRGHDQPQDRPHGARCGRARSAHAHQLPADHLALLLRRRHAAPFRADRARRTRSKKSASISTPTASRI